jgi:hypothetical protein
VADIRSAPEFRARGANLVRGDNLEFSPETELVAVPRDSLEDQEGRAAKFADTRQKIADAVAAALTPDLGVKKTWQVDAIRGPMGGVSAQVTGVVEVEGDLMPFVVSVYSDPSIDAKIVARLEQARRDREVNESYRELLDRI